MTDAQIEAIARAYCVMLRIDPDAEEWAPLWGFRPAWRCKVAAIFETIAMRQAIDQVLGKKGETP